MTAESHATLEDALVHEVWRQDVSAVKRLLEAGADPNAPGRAWSSAIACAGENDETGEIVRALVAAGADINLQDSAGQTPLHFAVDVAIDGMIQHNRSAIDWTGVAAFLDLGADPTIRDARGYTIFEKAAVYGSRARSLLDAFMRSRARPSG